jgi:hypothetical protein
MILGGWQNDLITIIVMACLLGAVAGLSALVSAIYLRLTRRGGLGGRFEPVEPPERSPVPSHEPRLRMRTGRDRL